MLKTLCNLLKKPLVLFRKQNFWIQLVIVFIVFALLQALLTGKRIIEGLENNGNTLTYFYMNGCPHCVKFAPEWDKFVNSNTTGVKTKKVEAQEMSPTHQKLGVNGFPTIMLLDGNGQKVADYNGARTSTGLTDFCNKNK